MNIIMLLLWSLGRGNPVVPSRWQATLAMLCPSGRFSGPPLFGISDGSISAGCGMRGWISSRDPRHERVDKLARSAA
jgi:hypothetical protein